MEQRGTKLEPFNYFAFDDAPRDDDAMEAASHSKKQKQSSPHSAEPTVGSEEELGDASLTPRGMRKS